MCSAQNLAGRLPQGSPSHLHTILALGNWVLDLCHCTTYLCQALQS